MGKPPLCSIGGDRDDRDDRDDCDRDGDCDLGQLESASLFNWTVNREAANVFVVETEHWQTQHRMQKKG